jgi:hypothetical protein
MRVTAATAIQLALRQLRLDRAAGRVVDLGEQGDESSNDLECGAVRATRQGDSMMES